jgi:hypothetical protein
MAKNAGGAADCWAAALSAAATQIKSARTGFRVRRTASIRQVTAKAETADKCSITRDLVAEVYNNLLNFYT